MYPIPRTLFWCLTVQETWQAAPLANLKSGAKRFIQIIDESTDGSHDGHIGIVSFASTATQDTQLITSVEDLNEAVNALAADGFTNHDDAFEKALELFNPSSANEKVIVMFTDGRTTAAELTSSRLKNGRQTPIRLMLQ